MTRPAVLVTGGATRIGGAITRAFAAAGWHVVIHYKSSAAQADELAATMEAAGLPYAPIRRPEDLYDDPHLVATGGLAPIVLPDGERAGQAVGTTLLPFTLAEVRRMSGNADALSLPSTLLNGFMTRIHDRRLEPSQA